MPSTTQAVIKDSGGIPSPQYYNPTADEYEALQGTGGAIKTTVGRSLAIAGKTAVTTAGTPVVLGSQACGDGVTIIANPNNTGKMYVFPIAGVKADVIPLAAGDSNFLPVSNISALQVDADVSGESVYWQGAV